MVVKPVGFVLVQRAQHEFSLLYTGMGYDQIPIPITNFPPKGIEDNMVVKNNVEINSAGPISYRRHSANDELDSLQELKDLLRTQIRCVNLVRDVERMGWPVGRLWVWAVAGTRRLDAGGDDCWDTMSNK